MSYPKKTYETLFNKNRADNYFTYVTKHGIRTNEKYGDTIAKANTDYAVSSSNYGARAQSLADSGLNGSGYEDYLKSESAKASAKTRKNAELTKKVDEYKNKKGYENYLSDYNTIQSKISESVIEKIGSGTNFSVEHAFEEAVRAGMSKELAYITAQNAVLKAKENTMENAVKFAKINNLTPAKAREYALSLGLDASYAEQVYNELSSLTEKEKNFYSSMSAKDYYNYLQSQANK